jgi:hypothetical protein
MLLNSVVVRAHVTPDSWLIDFDVSLGVDATTKAYGSRLVLPPTQLLFDCPKRRVALSSCLQSLKDHFELDRLICERLVALAFVVGLGSRLLVRGRGAVDPGSFDF